MSHDATAKAVIDEIGPLIMARPTAERADYCEMAVCVLISAMRAAAGDEYVRGFLEAALADLDKPSMKLSIMLRH